MLTVILFGLLLSIVLGIFEYSSYAWLVCWLAVTIFTISITFIAPAWIMPLFNKFTPLENSKLRTRIENYAANVNFKFKNIFIIDGSKGPHIPTLFLPVLDQPKESLYLIL